MQSPSLQPPPKSSSQPEGEHIKEDKGKKALSSEEAEKESTDSDSDDETHVTGSMVEPSRTKKLKKFDFITEDGRHIHLTEEEINHQKKLEEDAKAKAAKQEGEVRKAELVDLLGPEVVKKYYNDKLQYDRYCDKMLNRRAISRITNCDVLTKKGPITLKVYKEDGTSEIILNFKASYLHLGEWREVMKACLNRTRKGWEIIYKHIVQYKDPVIVVDDSDEDEDDEVHSTENSQKYKLELEKNKAEAEAALLKAQPSYPNMEQLLVKSLKTEFSNILSAYDFSSSLPTELKDLPSKFDELTKEVKGLKKKVHELEIKLPGDLKEIPTNLEDFTKTVTNLQVALVQAKLKTLDALPDLLVNVTKALNKFAQVLDSASSKAGYQSVPLVGQADTKPAKGEKDTNQATISQHFQRIAKKNDEDNLNKNKPQTETPPPPIFPVITTTTTQMQSPSLQPPPKSSSQPKGEHIKEDKGKKALSSEEAEKESTDSDSDDETHVTSSMVEPSRTKKLKKFDFITEDGRHIHLTEEEINHQKKLEEDAKAEAAKQEREVRKAELVDLLGPEVVKKYYNDKLQYDRYYDKMLNRRAISRITNCDVLTRKGPITLKVYREDGTSEIIPNFKASDLHLGEWREVMKACPNRTRKGWEIIYKQIGTRMDYIHTTEAKLGINLDIPLSKQDPLDKLNDLANKKRKHADDIHNYFKANKRLKSSVQYKDHLPGTMLNELVLGMIMFNSYHRQDFVTIKDPKDFSNTMLYTIQEIFFRRHQGPGLNDNARTFSSLLLTEIDKRNLNPLKQMRVIEQLRQ
ncbi:hypothetical protein Tco_0546189 [Tanacetum coccineum]